MNKQGVNEIAQCFEGIFTVAHESIIFVDQEGIILRVNSAFTKFFGYEEHEILGKPFDILAYKNQKMQKITSHNSLHRFYCSENESMEMTLFDKQGHDIPVRFRSVLIRDKHGKIKQAIGMVEHMVELKGTGVGESSLNEKMWEAQQNFDNVLNNSADAIIICDISGNIMMANKAFSQLLGYTQEEVSGKHIVEFTAFEEGTYTTTIGEDVIIDKEYVTDTASKAVELFEKGCINNWESYLVKKDKVHIPFEITMSALKDIGDERRGSVVIARDITERKKTEKEILETRDFLESIIESSKDGILTVDDKGYILSCNTAMEKISGFNKEELVGTHASSLVVEDKEIRKYLREKVAELYEKGFATYEATYATKDGKSVVVDCTSSMIKNEKGDYIAGVSVLRDITERKKAEKEIKETRDFLERIIESSKDGIVVTDEKGIIISVNTAIEQMCSFRKEELIGKHTSELVIEDKDVRKKILMKIAELFEKGYTTYETIHKKKGGSTITVECNTSVIKDINGNSVAGVSIIRDITERKEIEQKLLQSEKLKSLGELSGGVAHDFNNVLAAILGRVQLLKMQFKPPSGKQEKRKSMLDLIKSLDVIERASLDGAETVRRIQEFSRKRADDKGFTKIDINELVDNALEFTRTKWKDDAESKGVKINIEKELSALPTTSGSASELREVFTNLINNAVDAMPKGGSIKIKTFKENNHISIKVEDTGVGISESVRNRIFDPFFTTKGVQSTGLGMSVSYGIINRHGGTIRVDSVEGKGTTFTITIPISDNILVEEEKTKPIPEEKRNSSILVIEDEEEVRNLLADILIENGHQVETASDGNQGIDMFKKKDFDLVFTDLGMPGTSGWEVAETVKSINGRIPVAIITGWNVELKESEMRERGVNLIAYKPFKIDQILRLVQEGMELREQFEAA
jgi:PAS domain S-box-containing protein